MAKIKDCFIDFPGISYEKNSLHVLPPLVALTDTLFTSFSALKYRRDKEGLSFSQRGNIWSVSATRGKKMKTLLPILRYRNQRNRGERKQKDPRAGRGLASLLRKIPVTEPVISAWPLFPGLLILLYIALLPYR